MNSRLDHMKHPRIRKEYIFIASVFVLGLLFFYNISSNSANYDDSTTASTTLEMDKFSFGPEIDSYSKCKIDSHNNITTYELPNKEQLREWQKRNDTRLDQFNMGLHILNSYVYSDHISITFTARNHYLEKVYCRYYDCHKKEIAEPYETIVFPESTAMCVRKRGADYVSLVFDLDEEPQEPVKLMDRTKGYQHEFAVCLAPFHGPEPKWIQIIEFIEYYKLMGATMFYMYVAEIDEYTDLVLKDYVRTNEIELTYLYDRFFSLPFSWHRVTLTECHQRSKHHAKWTAFIDLDERMIVNETSRFPRIVDYLRSVTDPTVVSHDFRVQWVKKTEDLPAKYINDSQLVSEMVFRKYTSTSTQLGKQGVQQKCIVRSDKIGSMFIHYANLKYPGTRSVNVDPADAYIRHYREVNQNTVEWKTLEGKGPYGPFLVLEHGPFIETRLAPALEDSLTKAVLKRAKFVYDKQKAPEELTSSDWKKTATALQQAPIQFVGKVWSKIDQSLKNSTL